MYKAYLSPKVIQSLVPLDYLLKIQVQSDNNEVPKKFQAKIKLFSCSDANMAPHNLKTCEQVLHQP
jgi:hypothetical protein